ncbi:hypothetical protein DRH27_02290 [Candidatus Falkowbacteria bacterium]|nr:MAG: hypothetical protein DRH27_02290 [Candidatus Falkowbacteria bacterium]
MKKKFSLILIIIIFFVILLNVSFVDATEYNADGSIKKSSSPVELKNPLGGTGPADVNKVIGQVINGVLGIVGSLALLMFIYGGFTWMTAAGSSEKVTKGKDILVWAVVGLIVIFMSYAFVRLILVDILKGSASG